MTDLQKETVYYTWDNLCDAADGAAHLSKELKAKDNARAFLETLIPTFMEVKVEDCDVEDTIEALIKKWGEVYFDASGNCIGGEPIYKYTWHTDYNDFILGTNHFHEGALAYIRNVEEPESSGRGRIVKLFSRSVDPKWYDNASDAFLEEYDGDYDYSGEFMTDDDIIFVFIKRLEEKSYTPNADKFKEIAYELYKQDWLYRHTNHEMRQDALRNYAEYVLECQHSEWQAENFDTWFAETGFSGKQYVCFEEFCDNEFTDCDYMEKLLDNDKLINAWRDVLFEKAGLVIYKTTDYFHMTEAEAGERINDTDTREEAKVLDAGLEHHFFETKEGMQKEVLGDDFYDYVAKVGYEMLIFEFVCDNDNHNKYCVVLA